MLIVKAYTQAAGIHPEELCKQCAVSLSYMRQVLSGAMRPSNKVRARLAAVIGAPSEALFSELDADDFLTYATNKFTAARQMKEGER